MSSPEWEPTPDPELLAQVVTARVVAGDYPAFLRLCSSDAADHDGEVSVNRVRASARKQRMLFDPRAWSAMWSVSTGSDRYMEKIPGAWEVASGSPSRNDGRPYPLRRWTAALPTAA